MWNPNVRHMWQPVNTDKMAHIKQGDILAPRLPLHKNALVYTVINIDHDGTLDLISKPLAFSSSLVDLVTGTIIKREKLISEHWWYFAAK